MTTYTDYQAAARAWEATQHSDMLTKQERAEVEHEQWELRWSRSERGQRVDCPQCGAWLWFAGWNDEGHCTQCERRGA